jgi:lipopolysaccharide export system permease protein
MREFREQIRRAKEDKVDDRQVANLEYGYWNKIALPLSAFVFALVGAPLGIRNHRTGAAAGYVLSVAIILGYFVLSNVMGVLAQGRNVPPVVASFAPVVVGTILAIVTIRRKNH